MWGVGVSPTTCSRGAFQGNIAAMVAAERALVAAAQHLAVAASTSVPPLITEASQLDKLANQNRVPSYPPHMKGWWHPEGSITDDSTGCGLEPHAVSPKSLSLPEPPRGEKNLVKCTCPSVIGTKLAGDQCLS